MAKSTGNDAADRVADIIGRALGELANRKDALQKELTVVERQISAVRDKVLAALPEAGEAAGRTAGRASKAVGKARTLSAATRRKMADAARRRWAKAKKDGERGKGDL